MVKKTVNKKEKNMAEKSGELFKIEETELGKSAKRYISTRTDMEEAKEMLQVQGKDLIEKLKKEGKDSVTIDGTKLSVKFSEAKETIKVSVAE